MGQGKILTKITISKQTKPLLYMTAKEFLSVIQKADDYNPEMTSLIIKYGEMLVAESTPSESYWKKRCEAAEALIESDYNDDLQTSKGADKNVNLYTQWQKIKNNE